MPYADVDAAQVRRDPICVIGAGPAGLVTAHVLLQDGFENVQILTKDSSVGGVWSRERIYPTLRLNNVHGEHRFSALPMAVPANAEVTGGRLSGADMSQYLEEYYKEFIAPRNILRFNTEVLSVRRGENSQGWSLLVKDTISQKTERLHFPRIVICTGGCSVPTFTEGLTPKDALEAGFKGPVVHTNDYWVNEASILANLKEGLPTNDAEPPAKKAVVVVGGGKSAQDIAAYLAGKGADVTVVYRKLDPFFASPKPLPVFLRNGRIFSVLWAGIDLRTRTERFLHNTWIGSKLTRWFSDTLIEESFKTYSIPRDSPLRLTRSTYWDVKVGDEGAKSDETFPALAMAGKIKLVAPAHVSRYEGPSSLVLTTGEKLEAAVVIVATGYTSSWDEFFDEETLLEIGMMQKVDPKELEKFAHDWDYRSLQNPPEPEVRPGVLYASGMYHGLVPAKSIERRDLAVNGTILNADSGYTLEVSAHWISAYLLGEKMRLPKTVEEAKDETFRQIAWIRRRYPLSTAWTNASYASHIAFLAWIQTMDEFLDDMYVPSMRSGGNWLTWLFKPVRSEELVTLSEERRRKRGE